MSMLRCDAVSQLVIREVKFFVCDKSFEFSKTVSLSAESMILYIANEKIRSPIVL